MPWGLVMGEVTLLLTPAEHQPYYRPGAKRSVSSTAFELRAALALFCCKNTAGLRRGGGV